MSKFYITVKIPLKKRVKKRENRYEMVKKAYRISAGIFRDLTEHVWDDDAERIVYRREKKTRPTDFIRKYKNG